MFYDGPEPPPGIFDDFFNYLEAPIIVSSASFVEFIKILPSSNPFAGPRSVIPVSLLQPPRPRSPSENSMLRRAYFSTISVFQYSESLLDVFVNETLVSYDCPPLSSSHDH